MGLIARALELRPQNIMSWGGGVQRYTAGRATFADGKYETYAKEGYETNALVFACIEELATSASEPRLQAMQAGKWHHYPDDTATAARRLLELFYGEKRLQGTGYASYGVNPWMDTFEFFATVILHRSLAGNAYALKVRNATGRIVELWLLRPDRVAVVPDVDRFIRRYEYNIGDREPIVLPPEDVLHFKTRNPRSDFYGLPPLAAIAKATDVDNFSLDFVSEYFDHAGVPAGLLTTKGRMPDDVRKEVQERFARDYGGRGKWHGLMVVDGADASFTAMTQSIGSQGLVLPELNKIVEARITGAFGVPPTLVGAVIGTEASSYGNKKSERESFWNETLKPLYRELAGPLNRGLRSEFPGVQDIAFDLSTVGALREDDDKLHNRVRSDITAGILSLEEGRTILGYEPELPAGHTFYVPSNLTQLPSDDVGKPSEPPPAPAPVTSAPAREPVGATNGVH